MFEDLPKREEGAGTGLFKVVNEEDVVGLSQCTRDGCGLKRRLELYSGVLHRMDGMDGEGEDKDVR